MEQKCFTNDLHYQENQIMISRKVGGVQFRNNTNHNICHISSLINDADISAQFAENFFGLCCSKNTTRYNKK